MVLPFELYKSEGQIFMSFRQGYVVNVTGSKVPVFSVTVPITELSQ